MGGPRTQRVQIERSRRLMATRIAVHLAVQRGEETRAEEAIERCMAWLAEVAQCLTRFDAASELSKLNVTAGRWHHASDLLFAVVEQSVAAAQASGGLFDPGLLPLLVALGYDRDYDEIAEREAGPGQRVPLDGAGPGGWRGIELDRTRQRIRLPEGVRLDLGGIVKGWAADVALERFFGEFPGVIVNAGGDMHVRGGPAEDELWPLGIGDPRHGRDGDTANAVPEHRVVLTLGQGGMATSGATGRWWYRGGERQHHLLDPRTGRPARVWVDATDAADGDQPLIATATALAPTAAKAEVAAKVALLRGHPQAISAVERAAAPGRTPCDYGDDDVALILILGTGEVACSGNVQEYLDTLGGGGTIWLD